MASGIKNVSEVRNGDVVIGYQVQKMALVPNMPSRYFGVKKWGSAEESLRQANLYLQEWLNTQYPNWTRTYVRRSVKVRSTRNSTGVIGVSHYVVNGSMLGYKALYYVSDLPRQKSFSLAKYPSEAAALEAAIQFRHSQIGILVTV